MLYKEVFRVLGKFFLFFSLIFIIPLSIACYFEFVKHSFLPHSSKAFFESMLICLASALFFLFLGKGATNQFHRKESILLVVLIWILAAAFSSLPFCLSKTLNNPIDAYFESMSGLTTTGATVMCPKLYKNGEEVPYIDKNEDLPNKNYIYLGTIKPVQDPKNNTEYTGVEAVSEAVLFWRSFIQWLGGLGMIVLFLTIMPAIAVGGKYLLQAEMTGPIKDTLTPRIKETSTFLLKIYLGFTVLQVILLLLTNSNMPFLDALSITFATLSTGGFSNNNLSIAGYNNVHTEWITMVFMFIGSINFALYYHCLKGKFFRVYEPDFFFF
ncbi:MAG: TrkH family potassium uptake protein, partial [Chlamydiae bacterium]|nr:TrkH family potassium uptake protein [Chlamydiota bacterium]